MSGKNYIFGPVPSRRLGFSLGVDLVPYKTCSLDCIYCQLGPTPRTTMDRKEYIPVADVLAELERVLENPGRIDWITLSGSGEPTLNTGIGRLIPEIKKITDIPIAVLTNGTLLGEPEVRKALLRSDLVVPSLDAGREETFQKVNRPHPSLSLAELVEDIADFTAEFSGEVWLEVMILAGINDSEIELKEIARHLNQIGPDKVQLNTVARPPAEKEAVGISPDRLERVRGFLQERVGTIPVEVVAGFEGEREGAMEADIEESILSYLKRRPATLKDLSATFGLHPNHLLKYLGHLQEDKKINQLRRGSDSYFILPNAHSLFNLIEVSIRLTLIILPWYNPWIN